MTMLTRLKLLLLCCERHCEAFAVALLLANQSTIGYYGYVV
jgi:hypothetical protein